ncbi:hypothetical protein KI387_000744, partial [Taxus chinensis]
MREDEKVGTKNKPISTVNGKIPHYDLCDSVPRRRQGVPSVTREVFHRSVPRGVKVLNFCMQRALVVDVPCSRKASGVSNFIRGDEIIREVVCPTLLILNENTNVSKEVRRFISLSKDMLELDLLERSLNNSDVSNDVLYRPMTRIIRLQELDD